jgi:hypothetical protein
MTFPLTPHPCWDIRDSSKLDEYISCHRKYFFRHILGWEVDQPAHDLYFGECWHIGREHQLLFGYDDVAGAFDKFMEHYRLQFPEETDRLYLPKTPLAALAGYLEFNNQSYNFRDYEVVEIDGVKMTEISGTVPVDEKRVLHYKMDSVLRKSSDGMILSMDHKTTSKKWIDNPMWDKELYLGIQNGTYTHCLYCLFPIKDVLGVEFSKVGFEYLSRGSTNRPAGSYATIREVQAFKSPEQMNIWLFGVIDLLDDLDRDMDRLLHCKEEDSVLMAFQMNYKSCNAYGGCPYFDFCLNWPNPLQRCHQPEIGFKVEFWNPSEIKSTIKKNLEWPR